MNNRLIKSNDAGGGACTNTVDLYNPFPDGGGVALYQLNGDATDVSGNYDGTATSITYGTGVFGQAGVFNGSSKIVIPSSFGLIESNSSFTWSSWINFDSVYTSGARALVGSQTSVRSGLAVYLFGTSSGITTSLERFYGTTFRYSSTYNTTAGLFNYSANTWYHLTIVYDGSTSNASVYVNGTQAGSTYNLNVTGSTITTTNETTIGLANGVDGFDGSIDQVRIFSRALRPYEVEALYTEEYCTPTIVPSEHFSTVTYTGNGGTQAITGVGFEPDLVWAKARSASGYWHVIADKVRGVNNTLASNETAAERTGGRITSFDSDGFGVNVTPDVSSNASGTTYVAWNFKAGGAAVAAGGTNLTNRFVSANPEAGFSIMTYTGSGTDGTIEHGLTQKPEFWIYKNRSVAKPWFTLTNIIDGSVDYAFLNTTDAFNNAGQGDATDTILNVNLDGGSGFLNANGNNYVAYAFHSVEGFSNFGSYVGTGASGNTVVTGFEPAFVMIKCTSGIMNWAIFDNKRDTTNPNEAILYPNLSLAETNSAGSGINFLSNGFELDTTSGGWINNSGATFIYMAFAADPTTIEPSLEDSFNTVLYTGVSGTDSVTGVGFQPDLVWVKNRTTAVSHVLFDSVRGSNKTIYSNLTNAEDTQPAGAQSFLADGFSFSGEWPPTDVVGNNYVMWCWKAAELPAINSNGSITSVVSANPAAGFSIVSWQGIGAAQSIGHGLNAVPSVIIHKRRSAGDWEVYTSTTGASQKLLLNGTNAAASSTAFGNTTPTSDVYYAGAYADPIIAYCFAEIAGFSKFGSYTGNGSTTGEIIDCGFEPAFVMIKASSLSASWVMLDNKRSTSNPRDNRLLADVTSAEDSGTPVNFLSNGFQSTSTSGGSNTSGATYIYMAFADQF